MTTKLHPPSAGFRPSTPPQPTRRHPLPAPAAPDDDDAQAVTVPRRVAGEPIGHARGCPCDNCRKPSKMGAA